MAMLRYFPKVSKNKESNVPSLSNPQVQSEWEHLEFDPGKRKPISEFHPSLHDSVRRTYILGPHMLKILAPPLAVGPIFQSSKTTVQIARVSFNIDDLDDRDTVTSEVKLLTRSDAGNNAFPSVSPDGRFLVFRSGRSGHKNLYILDAVNGETEAGDGIRRLTEGEWIDTMPCWSPDGELIAFSSNRHSPENETAFSIYLIKPDGSGLRRVHVAGAEGSADVDRERINHVCFSPDSEWLLFTANFGAVSAESISFPNQFQPYGDLYICRLDGSGLTRLTCNPYENGTPTWHSKGGVLDIGSMSLGAVAGDKLRGQFDEPLWLTCDV